MEAVGLREAAAGTVAKGYSLGMRQRLRAGARPHRAIRTCCFWTSPSTASTPKGCARCGASWPNLATQRGCAVLVSSHVLDQLERLVGRYGVLARRAPCGPDDRRRRWKRPVADYLCVETPEAPRALAVLEGAFPGCSSFTVMPDDAIRVVRPRGRGEVGRALLAAEVPVSGLYAPRPRYRGLLHRDSWAVPARSGTEPEKGASEAAATTDEKGSVES